MGQYDTAFYLKINVDLCDLYFIAQWLYSRHMKYVGEYSFRFSIYSFVFLSCPWTQGQSFCVKFIRPHILKTLRWISFIFGLVVDIGLKFLSAPSPLWGWPWGQGHRLRIFGKKSNFLHLSLYSYIIKTLWGISFIFEMLVDIGLEFYLAQSPPTGVTLTQTWNFHIKVKTFSFKFI